MLAYIVNAYLFFPHTINNHNFSLYRMAAVPSKRPENVSSKRPPVSRASSSQEGLSDLASDTISRGKNLFSSMPASEGML